MLFHCWTTGFDAGPTLKQHWVKAECLLGMLADPGEIGIDPEVEMPASPSQESGELRTRQGLR